jgi:hypothetical protein
VLERAAIASLGLAILELALVPAESLTVFLHLRSRE